MSLLAPWFMIGAALIAGPIIAHLIRRATRDRVQFTALRFLTASAPRLDRRSRIQHPWLLALRCLIVALLALAFARPFFAGEDTVIPLTSPPRHVVLLIDESASMRRDGLWEDAKQILREQADGLRSVDVLSVHAISNGARDIIAAEDWRGATEDRRDTLLETGLAALSEPTWRSLNLDAAVEDVLATINDLQVAEVGMPSQTELHLVSDFAESTRVAGLAGVAWPPATTVFLQPVGADSAWRNVSLQWLGWTETAEGTPAARVRLLANGDFSTGTVNLQFFDARTDTSLGEASTQVLGRGDAPTVVLPLPADAPDTLRLELSGDAVEFDNVLHLVRPRTRSLPVVIWNGNREADPADPSYYLQRAVRTWQDPTAQILRSWEYLDAPLDVPALSIVDRPLGEVERNLNGERLRAGATVLLTASSPAFSDLITELTGESGWQISTNESPERPGLFGQIDFEHPLFAPFALPQFSDFSRIRFWHTVAINPPADTAAQTVARFDDGRPAVLEAKVGEGRLVIWAGAWTPEASQWVLSSKFAPWLFNLGERAAGGPPQSAILSTDDLAGADGWQNLADEPVSAARIIPGVYNRPNRIGWEAVAVNPPVAESRLAPLDPDTFGQLGLPLNQTTIATNETPTETAERRAQEAAIETEARQQSWRWVLLLAALLLLAESAISLRLTRSTAAPPSPAT